MSAVTPISVLTGLRTEHRVSMAQLRDTVVIINGHDLNQIYSMRARTSYPMGMNFTQTFNAPVAGAGTLTGTFLYRVRWKDATTGTLSNASAVQSITLTAQGATVSQPAGAYARATHWIVERTANGGSTYYPVNVDTSNPDGTPITTASILDTLADATLTARNRYLDNQTSPQAFRFCWANNGRIFMAGGRVHRPTVTLTNGSAAVSSTDGGFNATMFANGSGYQHDLSVPTDADGKSYPIIAVADSNHLTLGSVYTGTTQTIQVAISGARNRVCWSEQGSPEYYGTQEVGALSNESIVGDDGAPIMAGCGLGLEGCLYAKEVGLFLHSYYLNPKFAPQGDGKIITLQTRRGALGPNCMRYIDGYVYGIDYRGIWRMSPQGLPEEIGEPLSGDFVSNLLNFAGADNWHIGYDPASRWLFFFISQGSDTYPKMAYIYDLEAEAGLEWIGTESFPLGVTCTTERPDASGVERMVYCQEASGAAGSYEWMHGIGTSLGVHPDSTPNSGTVTNGGSADSTTTLTDTGATFYTTGEKLKGVAVTKVSTDGTVETRIISNNTATKLTVSVAWQIAPVNGDTYRIGELLATWRTGRFNGGFTDRKKQWVSAWVWVKYKPSCVPLYCRVYHDGQSSPNADITLSQNEDGVDRESGSSVIALDLTSFVQRLKIPLNRICSNDIQLEFYSNAAGEPWEIMDVAVNFDVDEAEMPKER